MADGPNSLAVDTGGFVIRNENNFAKALGEIDRDTSSYYVVGYRPRLEPDGKYRSISVRVTRPWREGAGAQRLRGHAGHVEGRAIGRGACARARGGPAGGCSTGWRATRAG